MNFILVLKKLEAYSISLPYVKAVNLGDIYEYLNGKPNVKYASVNIDINQSIRNDNLISYSVYLYYVDRLTEDKRNWKEVKTTAELVLNSIVNYAATRLGDVDDGWVINYFEQQFTDYTAGGYVQFNLEVPNEMGDCLIDEYVENKNLNITENGDYYVEQYDTVNVDVRYEGKPSSYLVYGYSQFTRDIFDATVAEANYDYEHFELGATDLHYYYKGFEVPENLDWSVRTPVAGNYSKLFYYSPNLVRYKADWRNTPIYDCGNITSLFSYLYNLRYIDITFDANKVLPFSGTLATNSAGDIIEQHYRNLHCSGIVTVYGGSFSTYIDFGDSLIMDGSNAISWITLGSGLSEIRGTIYYKGVSMKLQAANLREVRIVATFNHSDLSSQRTFFVQLSSCPNLSYESLHFLIENIGNAPAWKTDAYIKLGAANLAKLTQEDIDLANSKGWNTIV